MGKERAGHGVKNPILLWFSDCSKEEEKSLSLFSARTVVIIIDSKYQSFRERKDAVKGGRKEEKRQMGTAYRYSGLWYQGSSEDDMYILLLQTTIIFLDKKYKTSLR